MTHLDTLDPKPGAETQGPVEAIKTSASGVMISEYLPRLAKNMDKAAIVRSLSSTQGAHERGQYLMQTSYTQRGTIRHPALGAWLMNLTGQQSVSLPANVRIGNDSRHPGAGFMEAKTPSFARQLRWVHFQRQSTPRSGSVLHADLQQSMHPATTS